MKKAKQNKKVKKDCDPAVCDDCVYLGEGDFICWAQEEIVMSDWMPTEYYMMCNRGGKNERMDICN